MASRKKMDAASILKRARKLIKKSWCKEQLIGPDGTCCALGAVCIASDLTYADHYGGKDGYEFLKNNGQRDAVKLLATSVPRYHKIGSSTDPNRAQYSVMSLNDDPETVLGDMLDVFDKAIAKAEKKLAVTA